MNAVSSLGTPPISRRAEAKALFRNAILEAAELVFAERGFHAARIQDVAQKARIAVGTVYNHFEQKDDLLHALLEERTEKMLDRLAPAASDPVDFEAMLTVRLGRLLGYVEEHRGFFLVAIEHGLLAKGPPPVDSGGCGKQMRQIERFRAAFRALIDEGLAAGALEPMDPQVLVWSLGGALRSFTAGALQRQEPHLATLAPTLSRLFLHGAARRPAARAVHPPLKKASRPVRRPTK